MNDPHAHTLPTDVYEQVELQGIKIWRPPVPMPLYVGLLAKPQCVCGKTFFQEQSYREHYIYMAVWENESGYIPQLLAKQRVKAS